MKRAISAVHYRTLFYETLTYGILQLPPQSKEYTISDNLHRYRITRDALKQLFPSEPRSNVARHLNTLAMPVSGMVVSRRTSLSALAGKVPYGAKRKSRIKWFSRWVSSQRIESTTYFLPYVDALLRSLAADQTLLLAIDGGGVGRKCQALLVKVVYKKRALPIAWWEAGYEEPIYLVSNMELAAEACLWYDKRFRIETSFSDQKSRGFHLHRSHISDLKRLSRLLIAACLAYIWIVYLGPVVKRDNWVGVIHRTDRCDLSLFQLGLNLLEHILNEHLSIPVAFQMPRLVESVR